MTASLTWDAAVDHPELLAPSVNEALASMADTDGILAAAIDPDLADTQAFCDHYGLTLGESANCVVVAGRRGDVVTYAACVVLATTRADVDGLVRRHIGARKISFAALDDVVMATGMEYGGITPIGLPQDWQILVDPAVAEGVTAIVGSGLRKSKVRMPGARIADLPGAEILPGLGLSA